MSECEWNLWPQAFEFRADFQVIINLAVERDSHVAIVGQNWLVATRQIDDLQPRGAAREHRCGVHTLLVRSAMNQRFRGLPYAFERWFPVLMCEPSYPAQLLAPRIAVQLSVAAPYVSMDQTPTDGCTFANRARWPETYHYPPSGWQRLQQRFHSIPQNLHPNADQQERRQPHHDHHPVLSQNRRKPVRVSVAKENRQRHQRRPDTAARIESKFAPKCRGSFAPSVIATEIEPGPTVSGSVKG